MVNNSNRAAWAAEAFRLFQDITGSDDDTAAQDLICDLLHLERQKGRDPLEAVRLGLLNYVCERSDADEEAGMYVQAQVTIDLRAKGPHDLGYEPWNETQARRYRIASRKELHHGNG